MLSHNSLVQRQAGIDLAENYLGKERMLCLKPPILPLESGLWCGRCPSACLSNCPTKHRFLQAKVCQKLLHQKFSAPSALVFWRLTAPRQDQSLSLSWFNPASN